jgi:FlaA1/EpsC-like NDP-sugar epimerase
MLTLLASDDAETIDIVFTGLRPGEKLHEDLQYATEEAEPTFHPRILRTTPPGNFFRRAEFRARLALLEADAHAHASGEQLRSHLFALAGDMPKPDPDKPEGLIDTVEA